MLFLQFQLGADRYLLDSGQVAEVLPLLHLKGIPQAPAGVAGVLNYRGQPVPVLDLCQLALGRPAAWRMSTRLIIAYYPDPSGVTRWLGLIAERVTEAVRRDPAEFTDSGISLEAAPYLGPVASDAHGLLQWVDVAALLPDAVRELLYRQLVPS